MCGIIGVTGNGPVTPRLIDSLKRLAHGLAEFEREGFAAFMPKRPANWIPR